MKIKINIKALLLLFSVFFNLFSSNAQSALSGTYTIGLDSTDDYPSFTATVIDLDSNGVSGPVVFEVDSGFYC